MTRRHAISAAALSFLRPGHSAPSVVRAVAFDALAVFDPRPAIAAAEASFPGSGVEFAAAWRSRQFEYSWLRTLAGDYVDFWRVTEDALLAAADALRLRPTPQQQTALMRVFLELPAWPDSLPALQRLKQSGLRLVLLSNFTGRMLDAAVQRNQMASLFEARFTTDPSAPSNPIRAPTAWPSMSGT